MLKPLKKVIEVIVKFKDKFISFISTVRRSKNFKLIAIIAIVAAIPLTVLVVQQQQEIRQRATDDEYPCGRGTTQLGIGVDVGECPDSQGNTCTQYNRWVRTDDLNEDGDGDDPDDQPYCDNDGVCADPCTAPTATPIPTEAPTQTPTPTTCSFGGNTYNPGSTRYDCASPRQRNSCANNAGLGYPKICNDDGTWSDGNNGNPECTTNCPAPDPTQTPAATTAPTATAAPGRGGPSCPYSSLQARWQLNTSDPWGDNKTVSLSSVSQVRGAIFSNNSGVLIPSQDPNVAISLTGSSFSGGPSPNPFNFISRSAGQYTLSARCVNVESTTATLTVNAPAATVTAPTPTAPVGRINCYLCNCGEWNLSTTVAQGSSCPSDTSSSSTKPASCVSAPGCSNYVNPTVTPIVTAVPAGPNPTITSVPGAIRFAFTIALQPIGFDLARKNPDPRTDTRNLIVEIFDQNERPVLQQPKTGTVTYNLTGANRGTFTGTIDVDAIPSGNYILKVTVPNHLRKQIPGIITVTTGTQPVQVPPVALYGGNLNDTGISKNMIDILDLNALRACYGNKAHASSSCVKADLNDDGEVNDEDFTWFTVNLRQRGD